MHFNKNEQTNERTKFKKNQVALKSIICNVIPVVESSIFDGLLYIRITK